MLPESMMGRITIFSINSSMFFWLLVEKFNDLNFNKKGSSISNSPTSAWINNYLIDVSVYLYL